MKAGKVWGYGDSNVLEYKVAAFYDHDFVISADDHINFAFAVTDYTNDQEPIDNPDMGEIVSHYMTWGMVKEIGTTISEPLPTKRCSPEELGLEGDNPKFFPTHPGSFRDLSFYRKRFWCFDEERAAREAKELEA